MKEKQRIRISGTNWNDIIKLPCFRELRHYFSWEVLIDTGKRYEYLPDMETSVMETAHIGDTLVEYENGEWRIKHG